MNLKKCNYGHFYDQSKYDKCPHCAGGGAVRNDNLTVPVIHSAGSDAVTTALSGSAAADVTVPLTPPPGAHPGAHPGSPQGSPQNVSLQEAVRSAAGNTPLQAVGGGDDQMTVSFYKRSLGSEPVTGWLVCVEGAHFGEDFRLKSGRNFIGRATDMDVVVSKDNAVSRERHAVVVYEPKGNMFLVMPGESKELCYLNDEVVLSPREIKANDILTVGDTKLMFIPCCSDVFTWDNAKKEEK